MPELLSHDGKAHRVTLVFTIREGPIEGTDIGGLKVAAIADTPRS